MPIYVTTLPQTILPTKSITIQDLITTLPDSITYSINIWVDDKLAQYGRSADNLIFITDDNQITNEKRQYFSSLVNSLGIAGTLSNSWKRNSISKVQLYSNGNLIFDKTTMSYKQLPTPIPTLPVLTIQEVLNLLPKTIQWNYTMYLTGGLVKNGWSNHDADIIIFDEIQNGTTELLEMKKYFTNILGWNMDMGQKVMEAREPVYLYKIYENGLLQINN